MAYRPYTAFPVPADNAFMSMSYVLQRLLTRLFVENPRLGAIFFAVFTFFSAIALSRSGIESVLFSKPPQVLTFEEAAAQVNHGSKRVSLTGLTWKCSEAANFNNYREWTAIPLVDASGKNLIVYDVSPGTKCDEAQKSPAVGVLGRIHQSYYDSLQTDFSAVRPFAQENTYRLCGYCKAGTNVLLTGALFLFFLAMTLFCLSRSFPK